MSAPRQSSFEVRVPASTANLGAGFDCLGLALEMYLSVRATVLSKPGGAHRRAQPRRARHGGTSQRSRSKFDFPRDAATRPSARDLHCRACASLCKTKFPWPADWAAAPRLRWRESRWDSRSPAAPIPKDAALRYATEMEGHPDNVGRRAARRIGGDVHAQRRNRCRRAQTLAESDSPDRGDAEREARNEKIARGACRRRFRALTLSTICSGRRYSSPRSKTAATICCGTRCRTACIKTRVRR